MYIPNIRNAGSFRENSGSNSQGGKIAIYSRFSPGKFGYKRGKTGNIATPRKHYYIAIFLGKFYYIAIFPGEMVKGKTTVQHRSRRYDLRDWLSPVSKSRYG